MNHNEIIGWESYKEKQFHTKVIYLIDIEYHPQNKKRFDTLKEMLAEQKIEVLTISSDEENKKVRIMDLIFLVDWISFYTSVLRGFDPSEIDFIHRMKQRLNKYYAPDVKIIKNQFYPVLCLFSLLQLQEYFSCICLVTFLANDFTQAQFFYFGRNKFSTENLTGKFSAPITLIFTIMVKWNTLRRSVQAMLKKCIPN